MRVVDVKGFEGLYQVDSEGIIHSSKTGTIKARQRNQDGYPVVQLYKNNKCFKMKVHRIVVKSFVRDLEKGEVTAHLDGNKENNRLSNLVITTPAVNAQHSVAHGTKPKGEKHWKCKLTNHAVRFIRENPLKMSRVELSELFGCSASHVSNIAGNKSRTGNVVMSNRQAADNA